MIVRPILQAILPGDDKWLWRRTACLGCVVTLLYCIVISARGHDSATVAQLVIGLLGTLGIYTGVATAADHLKNKTDNEERRIGRAPQGEDPDAAQHQ